MARGSTGWSFFLCLCLSLATVLAHAVLPVGSPLTPRPGSAFSISTSDVALSQTRRAAPAKPRKQIGAPPAEDHLASPGLDPGSLLPAIEMGADRDGRSSSILFASHEPAPLSAVPPGIFRARAPPFA